MKQSEKNLRVIENFILHITHSSDQQDTTPTTYTVAELYQMAKDYIKEDHVDGEQNPEDKVTRYISIEDVTQVALDLSMNPTLAEIQEVLKNYDSEANDSPFDTWDLIVENMLYTYVSPQK